jgi:hypothetical protein
MRADELVAVMCPNCSVKFAITKDLWGIREKDGKTIWCPNGHKLGYERKEKDSYNPIKDFIKGLGIEKNRLDGN